MRLIHWILTTVACILEFVLERGQCFSYLSFLKLRFEEHFEGNDVFGPLLSGEVDVPELALAERTADVEVFQRPTVVGAALRVVHAVRVRSLLQQKIIASLICWYSRTSRS